MKPTKKELKGILQAHHHYYGDPYVTLEHLHNVAIIRNYTPDCPGWCGHIALVVHGDSCYKDIFYHDNKTDMWFLAESIHEGEYTVNNDAYLTRMCADEKN